MNATLRRRLARRKRRILRRIENRPGVESPEPRMAAANLHYELAERTRAIAPGGIGAIHLLARQIGLIHEIDRGLHLLKRHLPYQKPRTLSTCSDDLPLGRRSSHSEPAGPARPGHLVPEATGALTRRQAMRDHTEEGVPPRARITPGNGSP